MIEAKDIRHAEREILERLRVVAKFRIAPGNLHLVVEHDRIANEIYATLTAFIWSHVVEKKEHIVVFPYPATWWQHFKSRHFPRWLLARFPVRVATATATVEVETSDAYPAIPAEISGRRLSVRANIPEWKQ